MRAAGVRSSEVWDCRVVIHFLPLAFPTNGSFGEPAVPQGQRSWQRLHVPVASHVWEILASSSQERCTIA